MAPWRTIDNWTGGPLLGFIKVCEASHMNKNIFGSFLLPFASILVGTSSTGNQDNSNWQWRLIFTWAVLQFLQCFTISLITLITNITFNITGLYQIFCFKKFHFRHGCIYEAIKRFHIAILHPCNFAGSFLVWAVMWRKNMESRKVLAKFASKSTHLIRFSSALAHFLNSAWKKSHNKAGNKILHLDL